MIAAITGIGIVSPIGCGREAFWRALIDGQSGVALAEAPLTAAGLPTRAAAVREFTARDFITSSHLRRMDRFSRLVVAASRMAVTDAQLPLDRLAAESIGVVVGSALGDISESMQHLERVFTRGPAAASPMMFPNLVLNAAASYVAMEHGWTGVNLTVAQAEVSGEQAILVGADLLRSGQAEVVLAGGGDEIGRAVAEVCRRTGILAAQQGGDEWSSPYDVARSGLVLGEGSAMLVLESYERARARGATVYALLDDAVAFAVPAPGYDWPQRAEAALAPLRRLCGPAGVELICGGANSTPRLDDCEVDLFNRLAADGAWVTSIKGAVGEFGGAGALTAAAACLALHTQTVPPLCSLRTPPQVGRLRFPARAERCAIERALASGLARGGAGVGLLIRRAT
ncbi:MAG: beta-ketoacyl-[acyl-carrier-protein] synthase family protein [Candidatus Binatia bacterium]